MKLTEKTKADFEKWYDYKVQKIGDVNLWEIITDSMQFGVLVDYFDSCGIYIRIQTSHWSSTNPEVNGWKFYPTINHERKKREVIGYSRHEAREKAIQKANEIREKQL